MVVAGDEANEATKRRMLIKAEYRKIQENISQYRTEQQQQRHCPWGIISFKFLHFALSNLWAGIAIVQMLYIHTKAKNVSLIT